MSRAFTPVVQRRHRSRKAELAGRHRRHADSLPSSFPEANKRHQRLPRVEPHVLHRFTSPEGRRDATATWYHRRLPVPAAAGRLPSLLVQGEQPHVFWSPPSFPQLA
jgi:hypothetical protein